MMCILAATFVHQIMDPVKKIMKHNIWELICGRERGHEKDHSAKVKLTLDVQENDDVTNHSIKV